MLIKSQPLQGQEYTTLSVHDRALILEALVNIVANTELCRKHLHRLEPEGSPMVNRGGALGQDASGNVYHQLGGASARQVLIWPGVKICMGCMLR